MEPNASGPRDRNEARRRLAAPLSGSGVELGPGPYPFRLLPVGTRVRLVDQELAARPDDGGDDRALRSEGQSPGTIPQFVQPDLVADFNHDRLAVLPDQSEDFVIASHVLEHLAEPIGFIEEIHRVLRPGGHALILLPDRNRTEDRFRDATPLEHVVAEYRAGVRTVSDDHLIEFLMDRGRPLRGSPDARRRTLEWHRDRSIHVHCWSPSEFLPVLLWGITNLGEQWEFVDGVLHEPPIHYEFGYLLRRSDHTTDAGARTVEFERAWRTWLDAQLVTRPDEAAPASSYRLPRWVYRRSRALVRRHRWLARAYRRACVTAGRARRPVSRRLGR